MLLLRQSCQPLLDSAGLSDLHVSIENKCLTIVGSCGKPIVTIGGIKFSRTTVSAEEREFATSLFDKFLIKYNSDIVAFITAKKAFLATKKPELPVGAKTSNFSTSMRFVQWPDIAVSDGKGTINCYEDGRIYFGTAFPYLKMVDNLHLKAIVRASIDYCKKMTDYSKLESDLAKLQSELANCSI
jgi:hypothetical protein